MSGTGFISIRRPLSDVPLASFCGQFSIILKQKGGRLERPLPNPLHWAGYFHVTVGMICALSTRSLYRIANCSRDVSSDSDRQCGTRPKSFSCVFFAL